MCLCVFVCVCVRARVCVGVCVCVCLFFIEIQTTGQISTKFCTGVVLGREKVLGGFQ